MTIRRFVDMCRRLVTVLVMAKLRHCHNLRQRESPLLVHLRLPLAGAGVTGAAGESGCSRHRLSLLSVTRQVRLICARPISDLR